MFEKIRKEEQRSIRVLLLATAFCPCSGNIREHYVSSFGKRCEKIKQLSNTNAIELRCDEVFVAFANGRANRTSEKWWLGFAHNGKIWWSDGIKSIPFDSIELCGLKLRVLNCKKG